MSTSEYIEVLTLLFAALAAFVAVSDSLRKARSQIEDDAVLFAKAPNYTRTISQALIISQALVSACFGAKILSWQAFRRSILLSLIAGVLVVITLTFSLSQESILAQLHTIYEEHTRTDLYTQLRLLLNMPLVLTLACLAAEFIYVAKSRALLKGISYFKNISASFSTISALLILFVDGLTTVALFILISPLFLLIQATLFSLTSPNLDLTKAFVIPCEHCERQEVDATKRLDTYLLLVKATLTDTEMVFSKRLMQSEVFLGIPDKTGAWDVEEFQPYIDPETGQLKERLVVKHQQIYQQSVLFISVLLLTALMTTIWTAMVAILLVGSKLLFAVDRLERGFYYVFTHPAFVRRVAVIMLILSMVILFLIVRKQAAL